MGIRDRVVWSGGPFAVADGNQRVGLPATITPSAAASLAPTPACVSRCELLRVWVVGGRADGGQRGGGFPFSFSSSSSFASASTLASAPHRRRQPDVARRSPAGGDDDSWGAHRGRVRWGRHATRRVDLYARPGISSSALAKPPGDADPSGAGRLFPSAELEPHAAANCRARASGCITTAQLRRGTVEHSLPIASSARNGAQLWVASGLLPLTQLYAFGRFTLAFAFALALKLALTFAGRGWTGHGTCYRQWEERQQQQWQQHEQWNARRRWRGRSGIGR